MKMVRHISDADRALADAVGVSPEVLASGAFDGAGQFDKDFALWTPPLSSPDSEILPVKDLLDARARDMLRNDGYLQAGAQLHKDGIVGAQYRFNSKPNLEALGMAEDEEWAREFAQELESKFSLWAESHDCWVDMSRTMTLTEMVRLAVGVFAATGEALFVSEWDTKTSGRPYKTAFQAIDTDRLRTPSDMIVDESRVRGGIKFNRAGAPVGYYILDQHPGDAGRFFSPQDPTRYRYVPARLRNGRPRVIHVIDRNRPAQARAVSSLVAGLREMKLLKTFRDTVLRNAVVNASFAATIESDLPPEVALAQIGAGTDNDPYVSAAVRYLSAVGQYVENAQAIRIDGVKIPHLFPGSKLRLTPAGKVGGVGQGFEESLIRYLAATLNVSYEELSRDFRNTNMSSARAAALQTGRFMRARKRFVADRVANVILRNWFEEAANLPPSKGGLETLRYSRAPNIYRGMNMDAYTAGLWLGAGTEAVDELRGTQAAVLRIKMGLSTHERELSNMGMDWQSVFRQRAREKEMMEELGIGMAEDNSINAASGSPRQMKDADGGLKTPKEVKEVTE